MTDSTPRKLKKRRSKMSPNLASKFAALQADSKPITKAYHQESVGRIKKDGLEQKFQEKEYEVQLNDVSNITNDQIKKATTYKTVNKKQNKVRKLKKRKSVGADNAQSESSKAAEITSLKRQKEQEHIMRIKATENLDDCQKKLQRAVAAQENRDFIIEQLKRQNAALRKQIKKLQLKTPMNKKQKQKVKDNIDIKSQKILSSKKQQELFEGELYCEEKNTFQERWAKLTNIGELVIFENQGTNDALYAIDLVEEYKELREPEDNNLKFDLLSSLTSNRYKFKGISQDYIAQWIKSIKVVQYYWDVMTEEVDEKEDEEEEEDEDEEDSENKKEEEIIEHVVEKKITETDPFWIQIIEKMDAVSYEYIKEQIPPKEELQEEDLTFNKWKKVLWRKEYVNQFELSCSVQLIRHDTGKWDEDENNILFASVSKYGTASWSAWDQIADNLNRPVNEVMKKYSKLVGVSVKKLKKMAVARG